MIELILLSIAMITSIFFFVYLLYMNWLINSLPAFGLQFSQEWASHYYVMLRLGFIFLGIIVITSVCMSLLYRKASRVKAPNMERERYLQALMKRMQQLRFELWNYKRKPTGVVGSILLLLGAIALASSIVYVSSVLALIGLGLTFWGALFTFMRPVRYVKSSLLDSTAISTVSNVRRVIANLGYRGKGIYLPPRYLKGLREGTVFIPSKEDSIVPTVEEISTENIFLKNPEGICLTPSGLGLVNLFEEELGINFAKTDINYLQDSLPKLFVEGLEIAEDFEMRIRGSIVHVKMTETIYRDICNEIRNPPNICSSFGCPLCSSVACALARASGKPVVIEKIELSADGKVIEAYYRILGTTSSMDFPSEEQTSVASIAQDLAAEVSKLYLKTPERHLSRLLPNLIGLVLVALGIIYSGLGWRVNMVRHNNIGQKPRLDFLWLKNQRGHQSRNRYKGYLLFPDRPSSLSPMYIHAFPKKGKIR